MIGDHFSKWCYSFVLKNNEATTVLSKIKSYIEMNGVPTLFHTDNGKEFKNMDLKLFLENKDIKYITSAHIIHNPMDAAKLFIKK